MFKQDPGVDTSLCLSPSRTTRVGSKSTYKYPKRDPNWGYDAYKSLNYLLTKSPDPPRNLLRSTSVLPTERKTSPRC